MGSDIRKVSGPDAVSISSIDGELQRLWQNEASSIAGRGDSMMARVCTMNLIIYAPQRELLDSALKAVDAAAGSHPLRAICLLVDANAGDATGGISGYCRVIDGDGVQVCCEQIVVTAGSDSTGELSSAALELLMPELPVILWWLREPDTDSEPFSVLASIADKIVLDSRGFKDTGNGLALLAGLIASHESASVSDINWHVITPWREAMAELFDAPTLRPRLFEIAHMEIAYRASQAAGIYQPALLAGWVGSRMGWRITASSGYTGRGIDADFREPDGREISLRIHPSDRGNDSGLDITAIQLTCIDGMELRLSISPDASRIVAKITIGREKQTALVHRFEMPTIEGSITSELETSSADPLFSEALLMAVELFRAQ